MASIRIKRRSGFADSLRAYTVVLDGQEVGKLRADKEIVIDTTAGKHTLEMQIDWCSSKPVSFSLAEGESKAFECGNNTKLIFTTFYIRLWPSDYLWLRPVP
jgi:hypothetical protein